MQIKMDEYKAEYTEPWKRFGLTYEQWRRPLAELPADHRKLIFDILNTEYRLSFSPETFNIKSNAKTETRP